MNIVTVLAVVQKCNSQVSLADINPLLGANFESRHVPTRVVMGGAFNVSELNFKVSFVGVDI